MLSQAPAVAGLQDDMSSRLEHLFNFLQQQHSIIGSAIIRPKTLHPALDADQHVTLIGPEPLSLVLGDKKNRSSRSSQ